eukprot:1260237-Amphidinium_carterae.2
MDSWWKSNPIPAHMLFLCVRWMVFWNRELTQFVSQLVLPRTPVCADGTEFRNNHDNSSNNNRLPTNASAMQSFLIAVDTWHC